jgi:hypothetical protein
MDEFFQMLTGALLCGVVVAFLVAVNKAFPVKEESKRERFRPRSTIPWWPPDYGSPDPMKNPAWWVVHEPGAFGRD